MYNNQIMFRYLYNLFTKLETHVHQVEFITENITLHVDIDVDRMVYGIKPFGNDDFSCYVDMKSAVSV